MARASRVLNFSWVSAMLLIASLLCVLLASELQSAPKDTGASERSQVHEVTFSRSIIRNPVFLSGKQSKMPMIRLASEWVPFPIFDQGPLLDAGFAQFILGAQLAHKSVAIHRPQSNEDSQGSEWCLRRTAQLYAGSIPKAKEKRLQELVENWEPYKLNDACVYAALGWLAAKWDQPEAALSYWQHAGLGGDDVFYGDRRPPRVAIDQYVVSEYVHLPLASAYLRIARPDLARNQLSGLLQRLERKRPITDDLLTADVLECKLYLDLLEHPERDGAEALQRLRELVPERSIPQGASLSRPRFELETQEVDFRFQPTKMGLTLESSSTNVAWVFDQNAPGLGVSASATSSDTGADALFPVQNGPGLSGTSLLEASQDRQVSKRGQRQSQWLSVAHVDTAALHQEEQVAAKWGVRNGVRSASVIGELLTPVPMESPTEFKDTYRIGYRPEDDKERAWQRQIGSYQFNLNWQVSTQLPVQFNIQFPENYYPLSLTAASAAGGVTGEAPEIVDRSRLAGVIKCRSVPVSQGPVGYWAGVTVRAESASAMLWRQGVATLIPLLCGFLSLMCLWWLAIDNDPTTTTNAGKAAFPHGLKGAFKSWPGMAILGLSVTGLLLLPVGVKAPVVPELGPGLLLCSTFLIFVFQLLATSQAIRIAQRVKQPILQQLETRHRWQMVMRGAFPTFLQCITISVSVSYVSRVWSAGQAGWLELSIALAFLCVAGMAGIVGLTRLLSRSVIFVIVCLGGIGLAYLWCAQWDRSPVIGPIPFNPAGDYDLILTLGFALSSMGLFWAAWWIVRLMEWKAIAKWIDPIREMIREAFFLERDKKFATLEYVGFAVACGGLVFGWLQMYGQFLDLLR